MRLRKYIQSYIDNKISIGSYPRSKDISIFIKSISADCRELILTDNRVYKFHWGSLEGREPFAYYIPKDTAQDLPYFVDDDVISIHSLDESISWGS